MYIIFRNNLPINSYQSIPFSALGLEQGQPVTAEELAALDCYTFIDNPVPTYEPRLHYPNEVWTVDGTTCTRTWELLANPDEEEAWQYIREIRNELLFECDWTQIPDADLSLAVKNAWHVYRHTLRNITDDFETPQDVVFPEKPTSVIAQYPVYHIFEFLSRFTPEERDAGRVAAETDAIIADQLQMSMAVQTIDTNDPDVQAGMAYLVIAGVLTEQRKLEILGW